MAIYHFKTNVLLKDIIGQGLINNDNLAVIELVKNSLDANAKEVKVTFKNLKENITQKDIFRNEHQRISRLIIEDDGDGMNENDVINKWLNIAYSEKKNHKDINEKIFAGEKGVGRFSCDRLGKSLNLYSKKAGKEDIIYIKINWEDFEINDINKQIQEVDIDVTTITKKELLEKGFEIKEKGTIMEMIDLRSIWEDKKLKELRNQYLGKLIIPRDEFAASKTHISLFCKDYPKLEGIIENQIFKELNFRTTSIETIIKNGIITTSLRHNGKNILKITEHNKEKGKEGNKLFDLLEDVKIQIYFLNTYAKIYFKKQTGVDSVNFGSVFLFKNGFRVPPYGDFGNDWLGLEIRKGQGQARYFGTREIVGAIEIIDTQNIFQAVSSRDGLIENQAFEQIRNDKSGIFYLTIRALEKFVVEGLRWDRAAFKPENEVEKPAIIEQYEEDEKTKTIRSLNTLDYIIRARKGEIISIDIDSELIEQLIETDKANADKLLKGLEKFTGKIDKDAQKTILKIQKILEQKEKELIEARKAAAEEEFKRLKVEKEKLLAEEAKRKAQEESLKKEEERRIAETKRKEEEMKRKLAEQAQKEAEIKQKEEEHRRKSEELKRNAAEQAKKEADLKRQEEEMKRKEAEQKQKEEEIKRKEEEEKRKLAEQEVAKEQEELKIEKKKNTYLLAKKTNIGPEAEGLIHHIQLFNVDIKHEIDKLIPNIQKRELSDSQIVEQLIKIKVYTEKIIAVSNLITGAGFNAKIDKQSINIPVFIADYINEYYEYHNKGSLKLVCEGSEIAFFKLISPLELSIILDNLISNAKKWEATQVVFNMYKDDEKNLIISVNDNGLGLSCNLLNNPNQIFELGVTETNGAGIGLYYVKNLLKNMNGNIIFVGNNLKLTGATFQISFFQ